MQHGYKSYGGFYYECPNNCESSHPVLDRYSLIEPPPKAYDQVGPHTITQVGALAPGMRRDHVSAKTHTEERLSGVTTWGCRFTRHSRSVVSAGQKQVESSILIRTPRHNLRGGWGTIERPPHRGLSFRYRRTGQGYGSLIW